MTESAEVFTEALLLAALQKRHAYAGNGGSGRYAFLTHVRTGAAWLQQEIDAVAFALWQSEYHDVHAFEVKTSRTDWLREIKPDTAKSNRARMLCDTFTIVAPKGIVRDGELPEGWGLIEARPGPTGDAILRCAVKATPTTERIRGVRRDIDRGFVAAILRATGAVPGMQTGRKRIGVEIGMRTLCDRCLDDDHAHCRDGHFAADLSEITEPTCWCWCQDGRD